MSIVNYLKSHVVEELSGNGKTIYRFYNDTGGALSRGAIKVISPKFVTGEGIVLAVAAPATQTTESNVVGLVVGGLDGTTSVANNAYGFIQTEGVFGSDADGFGVVTSGTVAANDQLEVLNGATDLIDAGADGGAVVLPEAVAVAVELVDTNLWAVYLLGKASQIKGS